MVILLLFTLLITINNLHKNKDGFVRCGSFNFLVNNAIKLLLIS